MLPFFCQRPKMPNREIIGNLGDRVNTVSIAQVNIHCD